MAQMQSMGGCLAPLVEVAVASSPLKRRRRAFRAKLAQTARLEAGQTAVVQAGVGRAGACTFAQSSS